jgi:uncharacterized protein (UPF0333 family)
MEEKAQGALEYLLLIGGAVLVAAIVISLLTGLAGGGKNAAEAGGETVQEQLHALNQLI